FIRAGVQVRAERESPVRGAGALSGRRIAFTGVLPTLSRAEASRMAEAGGVEVTESVSGTLDFLVAGSEPGAKVERARRAGVAIIDERRFRRLLASRRRAR